MGNDHTFNLFQTRIVYQYKKPSKLGVNKLQLFIFLLLLVLPCTRKNDTIMVMMIKRERYES